MAYIGQSPITGLFKKQSLTTDGSTTSFDLDFTVASTTSVIVSVGGVVQEPETAYILGGGGTQITFTAAPSSTDRTYVHFLGQAVVQNLTDVNGVEFILDADADTSFTADTDDQIDIKVGGTDRSAIKTTGIHNIDSFKFVAGTGDDLQLYHDGTNSYLANSTGALKIATETSGIAITIGHSTSEVTVADNMTVAGDLTVTGTANFGDTNITNVGSITLDSIANDGTDGVTIDSSTDVIIDAGGADIILKDDGTEFGRFTNNSTDFEIKVSTQDKDIKFIGDDGGSPVTALSLDMSDAGAATFNDKITVGDGKLVLNSTAVTSTAAELNLLDGVSGLVQADLTKLAAVDATAAELNIIDGDTSASSVTIVDADQIILNDNGTMKQVAVSALNSYTSASVAADDIGTGNAAVTITTSSGNITIDAAASDADIIFKGTDDSSDITALTLDMSAAGAATFNDKIIATELDISGNVDIDGTLEADAITVDGTTLAEFISDTTGAMVSSNTETGITVSYDDSDNTLDFALAAAQTTITSLLATDIKIGEDDQTKIDFETADTIHFYAGNQNQLKIVDGALAPITDNDVDLGTGSLEFKDLYVDGTAYLDSIGFGSVSMTLPTSAGSANQMLVTDGSGTLSFADNSGISMGKAIAAAIVFG